VSKDHHVAERHSVSGGDMSNEFVRISSDPAECRCVTAASARLTVTAGIPGKDRYSSKMQTANDVLQATGVFVATVKDNQRFSGWLVWNPRAVKQLRTVLERNEVLARCEFGDRICMCDYVYH
jgi:hypothetical protein